MFTDFERSFMIDPQREKMDILDMHRTIEMSDKEYLKKCELVYRPPNLEEPMSPVLKEKYEKAKKICEDTHVIDLRSQSVETNVLNIEENVPEKVYVKFSGKTALLNNGNVGIIQDKPKKKTKSKSKAKK